MKSPRQPFRPALLQAMQAARETQAATLFDPIAVKSVLSQAADAGLTYGLITVPLDLRSTLSARTILAWCEREGLRADWSLRPAVTAHDEASFDLVISWRSTSLEI